MSTEPKKAISVLKHTKDKDATELYAKQLVDAGTIHSNTEEAFVNYIMGAN